ncbi:MAG: dipeptidase [Cytophagales bacterium]|nr:dipeptidase [Bernardetiaceae bacterium]MDW8203759.1 dipeptidase [Cytophagales bacterium]
MQQTQNYIQANKQRFLDELFELIRIPSVSAAAEYKDNMLRAATFIEQQLQQAGADRTEICFTNHHPIVYAEKIIAPQLPTVLVYGHYDVQPADPIELWDSPPFEPIIKNGKIYARGACDDKGQMYMHIKAFEAMTATKELPCNVKFIIEGEEEIGSESLPYFIQQNAEKLKADVLLISDTNMIANDVPSITVGLRGITYVQVEVSGPNRDLHSGTYGGAVVNPINALCEMIAKLKDTDGRITIPGFYDKVVELSATERASMAEAPFDVATYKADLGVEALAGEKGYSVPELTSIRPTLDVNGIWGGYTGEGSKTVIPAKAYAKISMRLVPNQTSAEIAQQFTEHFKAIAPKGVQVKVDFHHGAEPIVTSVGSIAYKAAEMAMEKTFGKKPIPQRSGGSIPVVQLFNDMLGVNAVLMGFGLDSDAIHSPNENFGLFNYYKGIETIPYFYYYFAELSK